MNKTKIILLVVMLTFGLILAATNFAVSAVAQTVTTSDSSNDSTAMDNATTMGSTAMDNATTMGSTAMDNATNATTTATGDNATGENNTGNPLSDIPIIGDLFK
jgi:ABC-type phosphate transport system substrate-binding protein